MKLSILGSSSKGNGYVLHNENEALVLECGKPLLDVKKALNFDISKIVGCLVTHEHGDHSKYVNEFLKARINTYMSAGTMSKIETKGNFLPLMIEPNIKFKVGNFTILPFLVKHDAVEPLGFLINHEETGNVLFVTDSYYIPYKFENLNNILIECNYSLEILQENINNGRIHGKLMNRTLESHMSFETCKEALSANDLTLVNNIVLIHLSDSNSNAKMFKSEIEKQTGKTTYIAESGMCINFNKTPF